MPRQQLISVVTPVYNGRPFIKENLACVERQTYPHVEHVILDNASTDGTSAILDAAAARDPRIKLFRNDATLPVVENWNAALKRISPDSQWCLVLPADDTLHPKCLERLWSVTEAAPSVGVVGSLLTRGGYLEGGVGLPAEQNCFPGPEIVRKFLRQEIYAISPAGSLVRADLVRRYNPFFPTGWLHSDIAAFFRVLSHTDFGFVHEVLFYPGVHEGSITFNFAVQNQTFVMEWLWMLQRFGPDLFPPAELKQLIETHRRHHYRVLVRGAAMLRGREFLAYHRKGLAAAKMTPGLRDLARAAVEEAVAVVLDPIRAWRYFRGTVVNRRKLSPWNMGLRL